MNLTDFVSRLQGVRRSGRGSVAKCPAHDDRIASLSVSEASDGRLLIHCFAGCGPEQVVAAVGLKLADLYEHEDGPVVVGEYDYRDEHGALLYQVVRLWPKDFRQRRPDGSGGWIWNLQGVRRVPYRLPELLKQPKDCVFFIVEGEKDADLLWSLGFPATTNAGGAGKWADGFSEFFEGCEVIIIPDNDRPGLEHAKAIEASLNRYRAREVHIMKLVGTPEKGDVSDWFRLPGNDREAFDAAVYEEFHIAELDRQGPEEQVAIDSAEARARESWNPYDLARNSAIRSPEGFLYGEIFPRQTVSMIFGEASSGKSYFLMFLGAQIALGLEVHGMKTNPGRALFLSEEMGGAELKYRTRVVWDEDARQQLAPNRFHFRWFTGFDFSGKSLRDNRSVTDFVSVCEKTNKPDIVFIDSLSRIHNADENSNQAMGVVLSNLEMAARLANVAIVFVHHTSKPSEFREGKHRARGAARIYDSVNDALMVECISAEDRKSAVSFQKARSVVGRPMPKAFLFTQEIDPTGRTVVKENGEAVSGVRFVTADYTPVDHRQDSHARIARMVLETMVGERLESGSTAEEVSRADFITRLRLDNAEWSEKSCDKAIARAVARRMIEKRGRGTYGPVRN